GRLRVSTILPAKLELWFAATQRSDYGMEFNIGGNQYHLDPEIYGVGNPLLKYSAMTLGPSVSHRFSEAIAVKAHGGVSFGRRFEYADGEDELADYGMESAAFAMVKLEVVP
ncbi:MAG: hypothetical protein HOH74_18900, partial [Gemmatimonadetes bacterium]|nr:hypothetical protein [Gemmatimonadota bacterium]